MNAGRLVAHLRGVGPLVDSPAAAWLLARMIGWSLVLPLLKRVLPLPRLVALVRCDADPPSREPLGDERVSALAEWVFRLRPLGSRDNCLDRSLVTYRYLGRAGALPTIVVGMARGEHGERSGVAGHAWVTLDGTPVHDDPESLQSFVTLIAFGADGRPVSIEATTPSGGRGEGRPQTTTPPGAAPPH